MSDPITPADTLQIIERLIDAKVAEATELREAEVARKRDDLVMFYAGGIAFGQQLKLLLRRERLGGRP